MQDILRTWPEVTYEGLPDWMKSTIATWSRSPSKFLYPTAKVLAREALCNEITPPHVPLKAVANIKAIDMYGITSDAANFDLPQHNLRKSVWSTSTSILEVARWIELDTDAIWNTKFAICLKDSGFPKETEDVFWNALEIDPSCTQARSNLAQLNSSQ